MKRIDLVEMLIKEGFSEKTIVNFSDKQLTTLVERITMTADAYNQQKNNPSVQALAKDPNATLQISEKLVGNQKKLDKNHNGKIDGQDFKILKGQKKKTEVKEEGKNWIQKATNPKKKGQLHKDLGVPQDEKIPMSKLKAAVKKGGVVAKRAQMALNMRENQEVKNWVNNLVEKNYHPIAIKGELMETLKKKLEEAKETFQPMPSKKAAKGHNGTLTFMDVDAAEPATKPVTKPAPTRTTPSTPPKKRPHPGKRPVDPDQNPLPNPAPKALYEKESKKISAKDAQAKVIGVISKILKK